MSYLYNYLSGIGVVDPALSWCVGACCVICIVMFIRAFALLWK